LSRAAQGHLGDDLLLGRFACTVVGRNAGGPASGWKFIEGLRGAIEEAIDESMTQNLLISFTAAWILVPIASWAIWRFASHVYHWLRLPATPPYDASTRLFD
jgi:hypothetical protein